ncbi:uncharacterized protein prr36a [Fundulus diaphanus]
MKPDGAAMEAPEPGEAAAVAEPSAQETVAEEAQPRPHAAPGAAQKANGNPKAADPKVPKIPKAAGSKVQSAASAGVTGSSSRAGTASHRAGKDVKSSSAGPAGKKAGGAPSKASAAEAAAKRPVGVAAVSSTAKNQTRALDKRPVGPSRATSSQDAAVPKGTKQRPPSGTAKRPAADAANGARPKTTTAPNRPVSAAAPKLNPSTVAKPAGAATSKATRPAAGPPTSRTTSTLSKAAAAAKPSTAAPAKVASSRAAAPPSAGRAAAAQPNKNTAAAKKDVSRPPPAAAAKKPFTATAPPVAKKKETSRPTAPVKVNSLATAAAKAADPKASLAKAQPPAKTTPAKKPAAAARFPLPNRPPLGQTPPPPSPASRPSRTTKPATPAAKRGPKPTQTVSPFTKKASNLDPPAAEAQSTAAPVTAAESVRLAGTGTEPTVASEETAAVASAGEEVQTHDSAKHERDVEPEEVGQPGEEAPPPSQNPIRTTFPQTSPLKEQLEYCAVSLSGEQQLSSPAKPSSPTVASSTDLPQEPESLPTDPTPPTPAQHLKEEGPVPHTAPPGNLNEEDDEEEREGSQQVSVSEMSGTTQPTEESRPGSGGPVGGAAWKAGGGLLSELDSEEVSGSQQGASELSAPGVLEGTESTDDLGDGSLKGAIDMEGASAGSPDFEKVPDIPTNDFEDDDDSDRVCDMEVGSERMDEPRRARHDNDVDEDEDDDDVEMASEGVTESGLESYGNADEDDFAEDERLDNLNRVLQPPPPPPVLPSAPAAQWDQPNPFAHPWAEPLQSHVPLLPEEAAAGALADPLPADSEAPTLTPAQAWLDMGSAPSAHDRQDVPHQSPLPNKPQKAEPQGPASVSAPGSPVEGKMSTPEDRGDQNQEGKLQPHALEASAHSSQPDRAQNPDIQTEREDEEEEEEEEDAEPETLPADEVLGGPPTAPTSNPSSSSATEDEASDTEGEAQLEESSAPPAEGSVVCNLTFDTPQRCLSTVEEGEEAESGATPLSAASLASYVFDSVATASNSNAQSTGESCIRSPGIFSLEELPEEAKEAGLNQEPNTQQCPAEQPYIECGKQEAELAERVEEQERGSKEAPEKPEEVPDDVQPQYYSICEKTEDSFAGFAAMTHPHRRDHSSYPRTFCDIVKPVGAVAAPPKLSCADLPPRSPGQQALSPQLRRLEQHHRQLLELQQRREQQSRPLEEAEQERKRRVEEEQRRKKEEAEEEIKRNKAEEERRRTELQQRRELELQLQQQQQELKQRQQILQWQQELQQSTKGQTVVLSPSSGLCTIYEALESSDEEAEGEGPLEQTPKMERARPGPHAHEQACRSGGKAKSAQGNHRDSPLAHRAAPPPPASAQDGDASPLCPPESPERPPPLDLDWGKKVDIVQQLINQTLLLNGDACSSLLLLPGGAGGTLSPLESSLWPSLLPPLTPPSATVTSVSSYSPEATGSSPQGEWTVVELETHH